MKSFLFSFLICLLAATAGAQSLDSKQFTVDFPELYDEGHMQYNVRAYKSFFNSSRGFSVGAGWRFNQKRLLGIGAGLHFFNDIISEIGDAFEGVEDEKDYTFKSIPIFVDYTRYFKTYRKRKQRYLGVEMGGNVYAGEIPEDGSRVSFYVRPKAGLDFTFNKHFGMNVGLSYNIVNSSAGNAAICVDAGFKFH